MARAELESVLAAPPQWLAQARAAVVAAEAEAAAHRARAAEERAVLAAAREATRLTDETVAELFGLPVDIVAALRPRGSTGLWNPQHVTALRSAPPPWLRSEEAARAEVALRESGAARARQARADRRAGWRRTWAEQLGVPLERVPENCGRPTTKACAHCAIRTRPKTRTTRSRTRTGARPRADTRQIRVPGRSLSR
ncbi:hypothetical protein ACH4TV_33825 [Streptomyces sp. NPDC020898]|uniref:hypothetical protein n=1 Tax=Streptomyces sp. NPDC020898 TaxID=3365101 RepID=UPI00379D34AF